MQMIIDASRSKPNHRQEWSRPYLFAADTHWEPTTIVIL
jgi:hypothetical protein